MNAAAAPPILVVEDSPEDFATIVRALRAAGVEHAIHRCEDGDEALEFVARRGRHAGAPEPAFVLLDLNLPGSDGREVLAVLKGSPATCHIPVVILTTSDDERDVRTSYRAGANGYVRKPVDLASFLETVQGIGRFWLRTALLPFGEAGAGLRQV